MWSLGSGRCRRPGEGYPLCQRSCRLDRIGPFWTRTLGIGSIRTGVQGSDRGATFAAGEFVGGAGISRGWTEWSDAGALVSGRVGRDLAIGLEAASAGRRTRSKAPPKVTVPRTWPSQQRRRHKTAANRNRGALPAHLPRYDMDLRWDVEGD